MPQRRSKQAGVFTATPFLGNSVAVALEAEGLDGAAVTRIDGTIAA